MKSYQGGFRELDVWKVSRQFRTMISKLAEGFPEHEKFSLTAQIKRSSRSITANIAEGYGRFHYKETIQFFRQSRGSLFETLDHLTTAIDEGYINEEEFREAEDLSKRITMLVHGYINFLENSRNESNI